MSVDDTKLSYYSGWDIDQLIDTNTVSVGSGDSSLYTYSGDPPVFEVYFQPSGSSLWFLAGFNTTNPAAAIGSSAYFSFYAYVNGSALHINCPGGQARYFVWGDKVDY